MDFIWDWTAIMAHKTLFMSNNPMTLPTLPMSSLFEPQIGTARYYTMKSVYRGVDEERRRKISLKKPSADMVRPETKEILNVALPELNLQLLQHIPSKGSNTKPQTNYIIRRQHCFRLKGLKPSQLYSVHRNKEERLWEQVPEQGYLSSHRKHNSRNISHQRLPPIAEKASHSDFSNNDNCGYFNYSRLRGMDENSSWEGKLVQRIHERYLSAQNWEEKRSSPQRNPRRLVSSRRLRQIIDGPRVLDPGSFYSRRVPASKMKFQI